MRGFFIWFKRIAKATIFIFPGAALLVAILKAFDVGWTDRLSWFEAISPALVPLGSWLVWIFYLGIDTLVYLMNKGSHKRAKDRLKKRIQERNRIDQGREPKEWSAADRKARRAQIALSNIAKRLKRR